MGSQQINKSLRRNFSGFTLLEVLIVLIIISIITAIAVVSFGDFGQNRRRQIMLQRFKQTLISAELQAILLPGVLKLVINRHGYQFYQYLHQGNKQAKSSWVKLANDQLSNPKAFDKMKVTIHLQPNFKNPEQKTKIQPILFLPNGDVTPFKLTFMDNGKFIETFLIAKNGEINVKSLN